MSCDTGAYLARMRAALPVAGLWRAAGALSVRRWAWRGVAYRGALCTPPAGVLFTGNCT